MIIPLQKCDVDSDVAYAGYECSHAEFQALSSNGQWLALQHSQKKSPVTK
jgi:hypothetical protein